MSRHAVPALLADIKARPDDLALRLILADWLEDHGGEDDKARAELIRLQVRPDPLRGPDRRQLRLLREKHGPAWLGPVAPWVGAWDCEHGLLRVEVSLPALRSQGLLALAGSEAWQWVDHVDLGRERAAVRGLASCPLLASLNGFGAARFRQQGPELAAELAEAPWLASVRRLVLAHQGLASSEIAPLLASPHLRVLESLDLEDNTLGAHGLRRLAEAPWAPGLRVLRMRQAMIRDREATVLAEAEGLSGLRELDLRDNTVGPEGGLALARSPWLRRLESLVLWGNPVGAEAAEQLRKRFGTRVLVAG